MDDKFMMPLAVLLILSTTGSLYLGTSMVTDSNVPSWIKNLESRGLDTTVYPGYDCSHGRRSFGCGENHENRENPSITICYSPHLWNSG